MFHGTKIPLQKWFLAISLVVNAKKSLSSYQLGRDLEINQKTAWYMQTRIRAEMASQDQVILQGIIEADETYLGGKPRPERKEDTPKHARGRGTKKTPILGAVQRGGEVVAHVATDLTSRGILVPIKTGMVWFTPPLQKKVYSALLGGGSFQIQSQKEQANIHYIYEGVL